MQLCTLNLANMFACAKIIFKRKCLLCLILFYHLRQIVRKSSEVCEKVGGRKIAILPFTKGNCLGNISE